ncbi:MAG TPA: NAD(P)-binding protein, partial [Burkholderiales bacterium]|nr:NAD(P)-binding protein [Burkholderiales bacterium]
MAHLGRSVATRVAIVGAGYAGMAAAVSLAERGVRVNVFESTAAPGGRARRIESRGHALDNGQHILIGAYSALYQLMRTVGVAADALLRVPLEVRYAGSFHLRRGAFGLAGGLLTARGIPLAERLRAARFIARLRRARFRLAADTSVS